MFWHEMDTNILGKFCWVFLFYQLAAAETVPINNTAAKPFVIELFKSKVVFSGTVDSKGTTDALAATILAVLPDLKVIHSGLIFDSNSSLPDLKGLKTLLLEVALSTHEGVIEISDQQLTVGGLTDSAVVSSVLRIRAAPLLDNRQYREQICLVSASEMPAIPIRLSTGEIRKPFSLDPVPTTEKEEVHFEPPGIMVNKLLSLIEGTSGLVAMLPDPVTAPDQIAVAPGPAMQPPFPGEAVTSAPAPDPYEELGSLLFIRNGIVPVSGQNEKIAALVVILNAAPWIDQEILVQAQTYLSSSEAFANWLSERRLADAVRQLTSAGIDPGRIKPEKINSSEKIDRGEVKIRCLKPSDFQPAPL
jgi:hypothetical protein